MTQPILFVVELGGGFGHVRRLLPLARAAKAAGFPVHFVAGNPAEVAPFLKPLGAEIRGVPWAHARLAPSSRPPTGAVAVTFADILGGAGFADPSFLLEATRTWDCFLAELDPVAVIAEHSPLACLAVHDSPCPLLSVGHGFLLPPPHLAEFPPLWGGKPLYGEAALLANANHVCTVRSRRPLPTLPALLAGTRHAVTGLTLLDPYRELRNCDAVAPLGLEVSRSSLTPQEDVFAYLLGSASACTTILRGLAQSGLTGRVFVRHSTPEQRRIVASSPIAWLEQPAPIQKALECARVGVHHGSMLLTEEVLTVGRAQVVAPIYLEHLLTARILVSHGLAAVIRPGASSAEVASLVQQAAREGAPRAFTGTTATDGQPGLADQLLAKLLESAVLDPPGLKA